MEEQKRQRQLAAAKQEDKEGTPPDEGAGLRQKWAEPREPLKLAQQADVTATLGEGRERVV